MHPLGREAAQGNVFAGDTCRHKMAQHVQKGSLFFKGYITGQRFIAPADDEIEKVAAQAGFEGAPCLQYQQEDKRSRQNI